MSKWNGPVSSAPKGCKDCQDRHPGCQTKCQKPEYLELQEWHARRRAGQAYAYDQATIRFESGERKKRRYK